MKSWMVLFCSMVVGSGVWADDLAQPGKNLNEATYINLKSRGAQEKT